MRLTDTAKPAYRRLTAVNWGMLVAGAIDYNVNAHFRTLPPKQLQLISNYRCNARCQMCNIWQKPDRHEFSVSEFAAIMDTDPVFDGIEQLTIAGGESSLRNDLVELAAYLVGRMPHLRILSLVSNGFLPKRILEQTEAILELLGQRGIRLSMSVSIDGDQEMHDRVRGIPGGHERALETLAGLRLLNQKYDFWLGIGFVVMHQNLHQAQGFRDWARGQGLPVGFQLVGFHSSYVGNLDRQNEVDFRPEDRGSLVTLMEELASERSLRNFPAFYWHDMVRMVRDGAPRRTPCPFALEGLVLDAYGDVYYCLSTPAIGNVIAEGRSAGEIYHDPKNLRYRAEQMVRNACLSCNSACGTETALKKDVKKYLKFLVTGQ